MPNTASTVDHLEQTAEEWVEAVFADIESAPDEGSVPSLVLRNRQNRAKRRLVDAMVSRGSSEIPEELERSTRSLLKRWAKRGFEDGFAAVEEFEIEAAEEREQLEAKRSGDRQKILEVAEQRHRRRIEKIYGRIELRGLQVSERVFQSLDMAYVPLHVSDPEPIRLSGLTASLKKAGLDTEALESPGFEKLFQPRAEVLDILRRFDATLIVGGPGSGKTTLVSYIATLAARGELKLTDNDRSPVPLVITVRSLRDTELSIPEIARLQACDESLVQSVLKEGRALVLVDGVDETPRGRLAALQGHLNELRQRFPENRYVVTSRPSDRLELTEWASTTLQSLTSEEVDIFVNRWCLAAEISLQKDRSSAESDAKRAADDLKARIAKSKAIRQLAETPLLATILCVVHRFLGYRIPERRVALYEACTNVLLYEWDAAKFPEGRPIGRLDAQQKRALLASIAYRMHTAEVSQLPADEIIETLEGDLPKLGEIGLSGQELLEDIRDRSGLLVEREAGLYGFSHLTFQEYLAASKVVRDDLWEDMLQRIDAAWWHEVIILSGGFPNSRSDLLVEKLLASKASPELGVILAARVGETAVELSKPIRERLQKRLEKIVPPRNIQQVSTLAKLGEACSPLLLSHLSSKPGRSHQARQERIWTHIALLWMEEPKALSMLQAIFSKAGQRQRKSKEDRQISPDEERMFAATSNLILTLFYKARTWPEAKDFIAQERQRPRSLLVEFSAAMLPFFEQSLDPAIKELVIETAQFADESAD